MLVADSLLDVVEVDVVDLLVALSLFLMLMFFCCCFFFFDGRHSMMRLCARRCLESTLFIRCSILFVDVVDESVVDVDFKSSLHSDLDIDLVDI